jgi:hypothetical protein
MHFIYIYIYIYILPKGRSSDLDTKESIGHTPNLESREYEEKSKCQAEMLKSLLVRENNELKKFTKKKYFTKIMLILRK